MRMTRFGSGEASRLGSRYSDKEACHSCCSRSSASNSVTRWNHCDVQHVTRRPATACSMIKMNQFMIDDAFFDVAR